MPQTTAGGPAAGCLPRQSGRRQPVAPTDGGSCGATTSIPSEPTPSRHRSRSRTGCRSLSSRPGQARTDASRWRATSRIGAPTGTSLRRIQHPTGRASHSDPHTEQRSASEEVTPPDRWSSPGPVVEVTPSRIHDQTSPGSGWWSIADHARQGMVEAFPAFALGGALALRPADLDREQCLVLLREKGETVRRSAAFT